MYRRPPWRQPLNSARNLPAGGKAFVVGVAHPFLRFGKRVGLLTLVFSFCFAAVTLEIFHPHRKFWNNVKNEEEVKGPTLCKLRKGWATRPSQPNELTSGELFKWTSRKGFYEVWSLADSRFTC
jgi:hypothetical protein